MLVSLMLLGNQATAFSREKRKNTNPRHNFRHDLIKFIKGLQSQGHHIILAGDFNEHIQDNNTSLQQISQQCQLLDIWKHKFPNHDEPSTYIRGSKRIDYTLISRELSPAVAAVGCEPFHYTSSTNHRGMFIDFHTENCLAILPTNFNLLNPAT
jgi:endonuclease/exonuclease/phosphatase family metal-dependent hydrolase